jgi:hypothetical protein
MAASIFVDPCIKLNHRKGSLIRRAAETSDTFAVCWASAPWSDVVGDYTEYTSKISESQIFLYQAMGSRTGSAFPSLACLLIKKNHCVSEITICCALCAPAPGCPS